MAQREENRSRTGKNGGRTPNQKTPLGDAPFWSEIKSSATAKSVLEALFVEVFRGTRSLGFAVPHGGCDGIHSNGTPTTHVGAGSGKLHCRKCPGVSLGPIDLIALYLGVDLPSGSWNLRDPAITALWDEAAAHGWCSMRPQDGAPAKKKVRLKKPQKVEAKEQAPKKAAWSPSRVSVEFKHLHAQRNLWRGYLADYAYRIRGWPSDICQSLHDAPPAGIAWARTDTPRLAEGLLRYSEAINRPLLAAIYDADGLEVSVSRRYVGKGKPQDEMGKAMAMASAVVGDGFSCRSFGSVVSAVADSKKSAAARILFVEGSPDYMLGAALVDRGHFSAVIGGESAAQLPKVARALRAQIKKQGLGRVTVTMVPDLKYDDHGCHTGAGLVKMREAAEELKGFARVEEIILDIPLGAQDVDLADVASRCSDVEGLLAQMKRGLKLSSEGFLDCANDRNFGYVDEMKYKSGCIVGVRASLGTGKTYQAARLADQVLATSAPGSEILVINHRKSLSAQLATSFDVLCYEDVPTHNIDESTAICVNSIGRLSSRMLAPGTIKLLVIDEIESVIPHLFGETLSGRGSKKNANKPTTGTVATKLKDLVQAVINGGGMILLLDAHLQDETIEAFANFCKVRPPVEIIEHITPTPQLSVTSVESAEAIIKSALEELEEGRRPVIATDSLAMAKRVNDFIVEKGYKTKLYSSEMDDAARVELGDVESSWAPSEAAAIIYTPSIDAGVSYNPTNISHRFSKVLGIFTGGAGLPATSFQQMMFRARNATKHELYIADRDDLKETDLETITAEITDRTLKPTHRLTSVGHTTPPINPITFDLFSLEASAERLLRLRRQQLKEQVLHLYRVRRAHVTEAEPMDKGERKEIKAEVSSIEDAKADARALRIETSGVLLDATTYDEKRSQKRKDQQTKDDLEKSRLARQFSIPFVDADLIKKDHRGDVSRRGRNGVLLRMALEGRWGVIHDADMNSLMDGFGFRGKRPDFLILAAVLTVLLPKSFWVKAAAASASEITEGFGDVRWSKKFFELNKDHIRAGKLLDGLAAHRGVRPDSVFEGISCKRSDLDTPAGASAVVSHVLRFIGIGTRGWKSRFTDDWAKGAGFEGVKTDYEQTFWEHRVDEARWQDASKLRFVEMARQMGFNVDPLDASASDYRIAFDAQGEWKEPVNHYNIWTFDLGNGGWYARLLSIKPSGGTLATIVYATDALKMFLEGSPPET